MTDELKRHMQKIGRKGGNKTAKRGKEHYSKIGKKGAAKRWAKRRLAKSAQK